MPRVRQNKNELDRLDSIVIDWCCHRRSLVADHVVEIQAIQFSSLGVVNSLFYL